MSNLDKELEERERGGMSCVSGKRQVLGEKQECGVTGTMWRASTRKEV